ncbi:thiopeptide-type bacteriocin biosynthesis protein [Longirhabdus pacifica]|uniref:thiopeptide-type bacteriocin biosynthesis protein n=1 Tax=Longirhabdus pacifica TaxID=2305227 RepID=UPI0010086A51|nr:thiopeptide-type bacteriocin biosynthesis protein [Longirhabdus pacifica]
MKWYSYHLFIHDHQYHDTFVKHTLRDWVQDQQSYLHQWFFIRYWQGGPHIRVRFKTYDPPQTIASLTSHVQSFLQDYDPQIQVTKAQYYQAHSFDGVKPQEEALYWMEDRSFVEIDYEPEVERYGGESALPYSESLFHTSSSLAVEVMQHMSKRNMLNTLILAADFFHITKTLLSPSELQQLTQHYHTFWLRFRKEEAEKHEIAQWKRVYKQRLSHGLPERDAIYVPMLQALQDTVSKIRKETSSQTTLYILLSQLHMYNNRIGLPPQLEYMVPLVMTHQEGRLNNV